MKEGEEQDGRENAPEPPEQLAADICLKHKGALVINLDNYDGECGSLTADDAADVLRAAGCAKAKGIYIHETMGANFKAHGTTWYSSVEPWCAGSV